MAESSSHGLGGTYYPDSGAQIGWKNEQGSTDGQTSLMACEQQGTKNKKEKVEPNIMDMEIDELNANISANNCHEQFDNKINEKIESYEEKHKTEFESPEQSRNDPNDDQEQKCEMTSNESSIGLQVVSEDQRKKMEDSAQNSPTRCRCTWSACIGGNCKTAQVRTIIPGSSRGHSGPPASYQQVNHQNRQNNQGNHSSTSLFNEKSGQSYRGQGNPPDVRRQEPIPTPIPSPNYKRNHSVFKTIKDSKPKLNNLLDSRNTVYGRKAYFLISLPICPISPLPYPPNASAIQDRWDGDHVKMPYSKSNSNQWKQIKAVFSKGLTSGQQLEESIKKYNNYSNIKFNVLRAFFSQYKWSNFESTLNYMSELATKLPHIVTQSVPLLKQRESSLLFISQLQIACLLANAFFCTFPRRSRINPEYKNYPPVNFMSLFTSEKDDELKIKVEKLKCIFGYFEQIKKTTPKCVITFERRVCQELPKIYWNMSDKPLSGLRVKQGTIELDGKGFSEVDFANKYIGGGVLTSGCVQEELRFLMSPELIVSRLFTEVLLDGETMIITGCAQYNQIRGYSSSFEFTNSLSASHQDKDMWGRYYNQVVAMDAQVYRMKNDPKQFEQDAIERTLNKAYTGFYDSNTYSDVSPGIASGKWGCGAFNGDPYLVCLLQLMAASQVDRNLILFVQKDLKFKQELEEFYSFAIRKNMTIKNIYGLIIEYSRSTWQNKSKNILEFIMSKVDNHL